MPAQEDPDGIPASSGAEPVTTAQDPGRKDPSSGPGHRPEAIDFVTMAMFIIGKLKPGIA